jgi:hypothetical protein
MLLFISLAKHIQCFLQLLNDIYVKVSCYCLTIFIGDFNVDMLKNTMLSKQLTNYMHQHKFILTFLESTTIHNKTIHEIIPF